MKLTVTKGFIDKNTMIFHNVGETIEYPEARAKEIEYRGFGKCVEEPKPSKAKAKEPEKKVEEPKKVEDEPEKVIEQPKKVNRNKK